VIAVGRDTGQDKGTQTILRGNMGVRVSLAPSATRSLFLGLCTGHMAWSTWR